MESRVLGMLMNGVRTSGDVQSDVRRVVSDGKRSMKPLGIGFNDGIGVDCVGIGVAIRIDEMWPVTWDALTPTACTPRGGVVNIVE